MPILSLTDYDRTRGFRSELKSRLTITQITPNTTYEYLETHKGKAVVNCTGAILFGRKACVHIHWLIAVDRGAGRLALQTVCDLADKWGVYLELFPTPISGGTFKATSEQLIRFYKSFGFKLKKGTDLWMLRAPIQQPTTSQ